MSPKCECSEVKAIRRKLKDEPSNDKDSGEEQSPQLSGSLDILDAQPDPTTSIPQIRAVTKARCT